ncbi:hypothetical protein ml_517 [Mollivirus sibericum]|uniref:hypothetical protein n=1 Tax=Mollivirus sibericum TaxID=1678078 RepID=UPI0006B2DF31|nr:hypothetical protein ml_7 [Mollivirus sibericum]YP_009165483.1 hypothetical protein ml_517 [Mollivirus sibericum]ALD61809.1 hypothetical protein ml_7 [Mollivirus sibericum]ALD62319.1 hypothetical protein ml_517 [Mollivirus sibericum]
MDDQEGQAKLLSFSTVRTAGRQILKGTDGWHRRRDGWTEKAKPSCCCCLQPNVPCRGSPNLEDGRMDGQKAKTQPTVRTVGHQILRQRDERMDMPPSVECVAEKAKPSCCRHLQPSVRTAGRQILEETDGTIGGMCSREAKPSCCRRLRPTDRTVDHRILRQTDGTIGGMGGQEVKPSCRRHHLQPTVRTVGRQILEETERRHLRWDGWPRSQAKLSSSSPIDRPYRGPPNLGRD